MAFIVECARGRPGEPGFTTFDISTFAWDKLLNVAREHGWKPLGCSYHTRPGPAQPHFGQPTDYGWEEWTYAKRISDDDARNLAAALRSVDASALPQGGPVLISDSGFVDSGLAASARQLAEFCAGGGFLFAVDD
jgi:hypothetical protein